MDTNVLVNDDNKVFTSRTSGDGMEQTEISPTSKLEQEPTSTSLRAVNKVKRPQLPRKDSTVVHDAAIAHKTSPCNSSGRFSPPNLPLPLPGLHTLYRRPEVISRSLAPAPPKGELVQLKPRLVSTSDPLPEHKKTKPPKFVPYEPYPGAVNPMTAVQQTTKHKIQRVSKNNLDIGVLADQVSTLRTQALDLEDADAKLADSTNSAGSEELQRLRLELVKMREDRDHFHAQYKFQTQVNGELKSLLVASVGEDLQTRVNLLTEDKLQLARALLDTANNLTTHTEQIEFLASQCEVWRSKFLASSVMVEELARWKADLTQKNQKLNESTKQLMHTTHQIREIQLDILRQLKFLAKIRYLNLPATDVISLSAENLNILQRMVLHSGLGIPETTLKLSSATTNTLCDAEKYAVQALEFVSQPLMATDEAIRALFGQVQRPHITSPPCEPERECR